MIEWDLDRLDDLKPKTIVDERWLERLNIVLSSGSEVSIKAGSNEMLLERMYPAAPSNSFASLNACNDDQTAAAAAKKKLAEDVAAPKRISELYLKRKYR